MKVLVDTSVWSYALRHKGAFNNHPSVSILQDLIDQEEDIRILGLIIQEILSGIRKEGDFEKLREYLQDIPMVEPERIDYENAANLRNKLLKKGIQTTTVDALIASYSIRNEIFLLTADKDFLRLARFTNLKLLWEG
ncbi:MAG: PIN domain-containing protein [Thermodesulfobacteriota bacterium]